MVLYFISTVQIILYIVIMIGTSAEKNQQKSFHLITDFLKDFIKPFLRSTKVIHKTPMNITNAFEAETTMEKLIRNKVHKLKHLLENNKEIIETDDLTLRGNNETTVIEFLPKAKRKANEDIESAIMRTAQRQDPLKWTIKRYKLLREQIEVMLDEENISEGTKTLIIKTLDEMIAQLIESQCTWTADRRRMKFQNDTNRSLLKIQSMTKKQWKALRKQYLNYLTNKIEKENSFMSQFHDFFSNVINDTHNLSNRYKVRCEIVEIHKDERNRKPKETPIRENIGFKTQQCTLFQLCSLELRKFLTDFYISLNDTAVSTFRDYAAMYVRDVNTDLGVDKSVVVSMVNKLGNAAERNVTKIYKRKINNIKFDPNKIKSANIEYINNFINTTVSEVKTAVKQNVDNKFEAINSKLFLTIKEDLMLNLEVDLVNLERHYKETFCAVFITCNSRYSARRMEGPWTFRPRNNNELFVKVQLSMDDEMKDAVVRSGFVQILQQPGHMKYKISDIGKNEGIVVTRTTIVASNTTTTTNFIGKKTHELNKNFSLSNIR